jgi:hypothetical protein
MSGGHSTASKAEIAATEKPTPGRSSQPVTSPAVATHATRRPTPPTEERSARTQASGPGFLGVGVESMTAQTAANGFVLGSLAAGERDYGCMVPTEGALIIHIESGGPAAEAGLHGATGKREGYAVGGDLIVALDGAPIPDTDVLIADLGRHKAGEVVQLEVIRCDGAHQSVPVTLGATNHMREQTAEEAAANQRTRRERNEAQQKETKTAEEHETASENREKANDHKVIEEGQRKQEREACEANPNRGGCPESGH